MSSEIVDYEAAGGIIVKAEDISHTCPLPKHTVHKAGEGKFPTLDKEKSLPLSSRFYCDCGRVWVVKFEKGGRQGNLIRGSGNYWGRETRRERRKRLGKKWWQRS